MDVRDVPRAWSTAVAAAANTDQTAAPQPVSSQRIDAAAQLSTETNAQRAHPLRARFNDLVGAVHIAGEASAQIEKLVKSLGGIVEQVSDRPIPDKRLRILEEEANQLVNEIQKAAQASAPNGLRPLAGDPIRLEAEQQIGQTLEVILPDDANKGFDLGTIKFSTKEAIINTRANVLVAEARARALREAVNQSSQQVKNAAAAIDVASQNSEAAESNLRDLDAAAELVSNTRRQIGQQPEAAVAAVGIFSARIADLLK